MSDAKEKVLNPAPAAGLEIDVVIEIPRGSFLKRGSSGHVDFISPLPCPFNYGSVPRYIGMEGDLLDALVLGQRLAFGTRLRVRAWGAVTLSDRGMQDDKLVCSDRPVTMAQRQAVLRFFHFYARCKGMLNLWRGRPGRNACEGWHAADYAIARAPTARRVAGSASRFLEAVSKTSLCHRAHRVHREETP